MEFKQMKQDIYTIKAIEAKGFNTQEIVKLSDDEIKELPLPQKLINFIIEYKNRGATSEEELIKEMNDVAMGKDNKNKVKSEMVDEYKTNTKEQDKELEEVTAKHEKENPLKEDEVVITRTESTDDDIKFIKDALQKKEYKSFQNYIKFIKTEVPEAILSSVDSTLLSELIDLRITEVKSNAEKNK